MRTFIRMGILGLAVLAFFLGLPGLSFARVARPHAGPMHASKEIKADRHEIRQDRKKIVGDKKDIRSDRKDLREDRRDHREDKKESKA